MRKCMTIVAAAAVVLACVSGVQAVAMEWVIVGDPGNADDTHGDGYGGVDAAYDIGKHEVTNSQYAGFLNAVATLSDPNGLYNTDMGGGWNDIGGISRSGSGTGGDPWVYATRPNRGNRPVNYVSWYDALRFANWMHNSQGNGDTEDGAYDMSLGSSVVRKPGARVFLPSEDEWYKAAYYKGGGTGAGYWDYPTESDIAPTAEAPPGTDLTNGSANYYDGSFVDNTYYTTVAGAYGFKPSDGAYGTFDQGGNVWEWNEADILDDGQYRGLRGGSFSSYDYYLHAMDRNGDGDPTDEGYYIGFRVAKVPGPDPAIPTVSQWGLVAMALLVLTAGTLVWARRGAAKKESAVSPSEHITAL